MNFTIIALHMTLLSKSPLFSKEPSLYLQKSSFSRFSSPIAFNVYGKISKSSFSQGLSTAIMMEEDKFEPNSDINISNLPGLQVTENYFHDNNNNDGKALINIHGNGASKNVLFYMNTIYKCSTNNAQGLIIINTDANTNISYNCLADAFSGGATFYLAAGGIVSLTTITEVSSSKSSSIYDINSASLKATSFSHINITKINFLLDGAFNVRPRSSANINFFTYDVSYNRNGFTVHEDSTFSMSNCQIFDLTVDDTIFIAGSSLFISHSYFFGLIFDLFTNPRNSRILVEFSNCGFDLARGIIKEDHISLINCIFDMEISFTVNAEFLNSGNCHGFHFETYQSFVKQFSTQEIVGIFFCAIGIIITLLLIVVQFFRRNKQIIEEENFYSEYSEYSYSFLSENEGDTEEELQELEQEEEKPRKRK